MNYKLVKAILIIILIFNGNSIKADNIKDTLKIRLNTVDFTSKNDTIKLIGEIDMISEKINIPKKESTDWKGYFIPILLGLLAALIALYQVKLNNMTSAKIKWVEKFREVLSNYLMNIDSSAVNLVNLNHIKKLEPKPEEKSERYYDYYDKYCESTDLATRHYFQLKLLFYKKNEDFKNLESLIDELDSFYATVNHDDDTNNLREKIMSTIDLSQQVLSKEWKMIEKRFYKT